jgi:hypothetical protein
MERNSSSSKIFKRNLTHQMGLLLRTHRMKDNVLLIQPMVEIMRKYAVMTIDEAMHVPEYEELKFGTQELEDLKRQANIARQRLRPSRENCTTKAIEASCLEFNRKVVETKGYAAQEAQIKEGSGGGCQPLDPQGILGLSKFIFKEYFQNNVQVIHILQVVLCFIMICNYNI